MFTFKNNLILVTCCILVFASSNFNLLRGQDIKLALPQALTSKTKYHDFEFIFNKNKTFLTIIENYHDIQFNNKGQFIYDIEIASLDPNAIIILKDKHNKKCALKLLTYNNVASVNRRLIMFEDVKKTEDRNKVQLGNWEISQHLQAIEQFRDSLVKHIKKMRQGKDYPICTTKIGSTGLAIFGRGMGMNISDDDPVYNFVADMPKFQGINEPRALNEKIQIYFNQKIKRDSISDQGIVKAEVVIDENGKIIRSYILHASSKKIKGLTKKYIEEMPNWTPGTHLGKAVKVEYTMLFDFNKTANKYDHSN